MYATYLPRWFRPCRDILVSIDKPDVMSDITTQVNVLAVFLAAE